MKTAIILTLLTLSLRAHGATAAASPDPFNVVWDAPSQDHHGSMPLGNGDIGLNAWATTNGDLHVYISKTDAWDDSARLLKVGKVRLHLNPNPFAATRPFRQQLRLRDATLEIVAGTDGDAETRVELWVDANQPVIHATVTSTTPIEATAHLELWRTQRTGISDLQISDVLMNQKLPNGEKPRIVVEPDTVLADQPNRIGWFHHNTQSVGPRFLAEIQGLTDFPQADPLLHRTFGGMVTAAKAVRVDDRQLRSPPARSHQFNVFVLTEHPSTPERWLSAMDTTIRRVEAARFEKRRRAHRAWWDAFWNRSWIRATTGTNVPSTASAPGLLPANEHPVRIGSDQGDGNRFPGTLGRVSVFARALAGDEITALAQTDRAQPPAPDPALRFSGANVVPTPLADSARWSFDRGLTVEAWVRPPALPGGGARIVDKVTPGVNDGFLLDTFPGNSLRFLCGDTRLEQANALPVDVWTHVAAVVDPETGGCRLYVSGKLVAGDAPAAPRDDAAHVSQMYHLQRFITACAGRGAFPIKFNGSLFTVPPGPTEADPDYRRWGPGYWWQNTRLPYISLCASGDFDVQRPLFRMYADELLPLSRYRTRRYFGHDGAFYPECIMFWGPVFSETYGWTPFEERTDKLQESGWHKWEWVGGLELACLMLDYHDHTGDRAFLRSTALPFAREILLFFEQHYPTNAQGKLVMHPAQALETWWQCTNAMPELAGCRALTTRLLDLPPDRIAASDRARWQRLQAMLPPVPTRDIEGRRALAPAETFAQKNNIENPELYAVYPFRLFAFNRPHPEWALEALRHRWDKGDSGWRQDDIFMAFLGLTEEARRALVARAKVHDPAERFPAFWGPNYDWTPDQDHGGVLMKTLQSMLLQTDGDRIFLLPAWPRHWNVEFKLHAPRQTILEGTFRNGRLERLRVTPGSRSQDVTLVPALEPMPQP